MLGELAGVGATDVRLEVSGGRSMAERLSGQENAVEVAQRLAGEWLHRMLGRGGRRERRRQHRCRIEHDRVGRVDGMLAAIGGQPTIWLGATSVAGTGFWARPNILAFNGEVERLVEGAPNVVYADWDAAASGQPWYVSDGIHPNADGSAAMASFIADHLLFFYPQR